MSELNVYHHELRPDEYAEFYLKYEADKVISRLKAENEQLKEKLEDARATVAFNRLDAVMRERKLKRALYKACANWAMNARMVEIETEPWGENRESRLWAGVYDKCLKKAEEYR